MVIQQKKKQSKLMNTAITCLVIVAAFWYLSSSSTPSQTALAPLKNPAAQVKESTARNTTPATSTTANVPEKKPPVDELPAAFPADRVVRTQPPADVELPPDLQRQLDAPPPQLPEDLKAQLNAPPPEMPEDLKAQLNAPPPEIPEDIKRAMETPPRIVTIDEVNNPDLLNKK